MDLTGCEAFLAHRYGHATRRANEAALLTHVESALASLGVTARAAVAPTVGLAWAACRFGDEAIDVTEMAASVDTAESIGVSESIGDVNQSVGVSEPIRATRSFGTIESRGDAMPAFDVVASVGAATADPPH